MKLKQTILVCTLLLVFLSLGSVSALDDEISYDNLTTSSIQEDFLSETQINESNLEKCEIQEDLADELKVEDSEIQQATICDEDVEITSSEDRDDNLAYDDGNIIVEIFSGPYYLGYSDPICRIVDNGGVDGYITIMIDGQSKYDTFGSSSGYVTS